MKMLIRKHYFIYITSNKINGKSYVGFHSTDNLNDNYFGSGRYLKNAIKKYEKNNFSREILEFCTKDNWKEKECFWIAKMNTKYPIGYNLTDGGEGFAGKIIFEKTKKLMSKTRRERNLAKGENNGMFGKPHSKISKINMGKTKKENGCAKGKNNSKFDHTIYTFYNKLTTEIFVGHKYDLANKINSNSSALNALIKGKRNHHKNWVYRNNTK